MAEKDELHHQLHKKSKSETKDRLSALPDPILLLIMSFLSTKEVVKTCLLSKRWQFLWTNISEIDVANHLLDVSNIGRFVDWVGKLLLMCGGFNLTKFAVHFCFGADFGSDIDTWLQFMVKNKVKDITLKLCRHEDLLCFYTLSQMFYSHSYLTSLTLADISVNPLGKVMWLSLKSLTLEGVFLSEFEMEKMLSGSPVLEILRLHSCWGFSCLNITSPKLITLVIEHKERFSNPSFFRVSAPYVVTLSIKITTIGYDFKLINVSSVVRAVLNFDSNDIVDHDDDHSLQMNYMKELLVSLKDVKELELGPWHIEVLSYLVMNGWQLPPSIRSCLTINALRVKRSIPGILGLLNSSPNLETLVIKGINPSSYQECLLEELNKSAGDPFEAYLHNANLDFVSFGVKTVKIIGFTKSFGSVEPLATLVKFLLKGATCLEKICISTEDLDTFRAAMTLISLPRASPKAVIVFD